MTIHASLSPNRPFTEKARFLGAVARQPVDRPRWLMRQAGRYLPQYMEVKQYTFGNVPVPDIAAESPSSRMRFWAWTPSSSSTTS